MKKYALQKRIAAVAVTASFVIGFAGCGLNDKLISISTRSMSEREETTMSAAGTASESLDVDRLWLAPTIEAEPVESEQEPEAETSEVAASEASGAEQAETEDVQEAVTSDSSEDEKPEKRTRNEVEVPEILQMPELPTGCESVALTIVLESLGFQLEKTEIAKDYLIYGDNFATSYVGDPFSESGAGAFPVAIVRTANKYLRKQQSKLRAKNISGSSLRKLYDYIDEGKPVIVWHTMYMEEPEFNGQSQEYDGQTYRWYSLEHCIVVYGYDDEAKTVLVSDPLEGYKERDAAAFDRLYRLTGQYAVVIE